MVLMARDHVTTQPVRTEISAGAHKEVLEVMCVGGEHGKRVGAHCIRSAGAAARSRTEEGRAPRSESTEAESGRFFAGEDAEIVAVCRMIQKKEFSPIRKPARQEKGEPLL